MTSVVGLKAILHRDIVSPTVYVEIFAGILFREIMKNQAPRNFRSFNFRDYVACLILRPTYVQFLQFLFSRMQTNSRNTRKLIHCENFNVYGTIYLRIAVACLCSDCMSATKRQVHVAACAMSDRSSHFLFDWRRMACHVDPGCCCYR